MNSLNEFSLAAPLLEGKLLIYSLPICEVLVVNDQNFPLWLVLVPRIADLTEITELSQSQQASIWTEVWQAAGIVKEVFPQCKLNIASLGNIVSQLHIHITARIPSDPAWPGPCYGAVPAKAWNGEAFQQMVKLLQSEFARLQV